MQDSVTAVINAIRNLTGIGICYYDLESFFNYEKQGAKNNRGHYCAFCEKARSLPEGRLGCEKSDRDEAVTLARQYKEPFFFECHMGMRELIVPLIRDERLLGILFVGQCRTEHDRSDAVRQAASRYTENAEEMVKLYEALPALSQTDVLSVGTILSHYFDVKIENNTLLSGGELSVKASGDLVNAIRSYISANYKYPITPRDIAKHFFISPAYASRRFSEATGSTIIEQIMQVRLGRAKIYLKTTDASIENIALNVGFENPNYFARAFKKRVGVTPSEYRRSHG